MVPMHKSQRLINHVALVLDASGSMDVHKDKVAKVADEQIAHLMRVSEQLKQETRVSVYLFDNEVFCLIFDMDVMRLPSISELYTIGGATALVDALVKSQEDLATTSQIYGDHAFLTFVLTDGDENRSRIEDKMGAVRKYTAEAGENWTVGFLVPDNAGVAYLLRCGVPGESIIIWDAQSKDGMIGAGKAIEAATTSYLTARSTGKRGTKSVFAEAAMGADKVNTQTVKEKLAPMARKDYKLVDVFCAGEKVRQDEFVEKQMGGHFVCGHGYYQFTKKELVHGNKPIIVVEKATGQAYAGPEARALVGLTWGVDAKVQPADNPEFDIFIQSQAPNRLLVNGTKFLYLK
jgi:hypothetical protein